MLSIWAVLPIAVYLLQARFFLRRASGPQDRSRALLDAALLWGITVTTITELASALRSIGWVFFAVSWAVVGGALVVADLRTAPRARGARMHATKLRDPLLVGGIAGTSAIALGTLTAALFGWPNQWDSMVYHLPRIDHWLQNGSIEFYPTHVPRQLFNPPWAEYAILQFHALGAESRFANLVQWFSMVGSLVGVASIVRRSGASASMQWLSVLTAASIPMGVLQAPTTQNDHVVAFWLVCLVDGVVAPSSLATRAMRAGAACGLAVLTKGTALIFAPILLVCLWTAGTERLAALARAALVVAILTIGLNTAHWARNVEWYGNPFGPSELGSAMGSGDRLVNDEFSFALVGSNVLRNAALHAALPWETWNHQVERIVQAAHSLIGVDPFDPRVTRPYPETHYEVRGPLGDPDRTGNPWHLLLIVVSALAVWWMPTNARVPRRLVIALLVAALAFCVLLKWQPWHSRLHLPLFVLGSSLVGRALEKFRSAQMAVVAISLVLVLPPLLRNRLAPLLGERNVFNTSSVDQTFQSFGGRPMEMQSAVLGALARIRELGCSRVGLVLGWDDWEHPFWLFFPHAGETRRLEHVLVEKTGPDEFRPCAIISTKSVTGETVDVAGLGYEPVWDEDMGRSRRISVLVPRSRD